MFFNNGWNKNARDGDTGKQYIEYNLVHHMIQALERCNIFNTTSRPNLRNTSRH